MTHDLLIRRHSLSSDVGTVAVRSGQTLEQMLMEAAGGSVSHELDVRVNGHVIPAKYWSRVRPKEGAVIHVCRDALAGGGGGWKQILGAVILIVVSIFAPGWGTAIATSLGLGATAGTIIAAGIVLATSLAITALTAPPSPTSQGDGPGQWHQLTGTGNSINPWGAIPIVLGGSRFYPPHAAEGYVKVVRDKSYHHYVFDLGYGDLDLSQLDLRIGDTSVSEYNEVQYEITTGSSTLYQDDVSQLSVQASLEYGDIVERTSAQNSDSIGFDIVFPQGLFWINDRGRNFNYEAKFEIGWRAVGSSTWLDLPANARRSGIFRRMGIETVDTLNKDPFGVSASWDVAPGQYEIRIRRIPITNEDSRNTYITSAIFAYLTSIRKTEPSRTGTNKIYMRILATGQLTGQLQTLSCYVQQLIPVYNEQTGQWMERQPSRNPAWVDYWLLTRCPAASKHVPDSRMHLDDYVEYANWCDANGLETRIVQDARITLGEMHRKVLSGALASPGNRDGKYSVVFDHGDTVPTMCFSPLDTAGFSESRAFIQIPHALRIQFVNPLANWQEDEVVVLRDGYSYRGVDARGNPSSAPPAETFETMRTEQSMLPKQAWRLGRYHFAQAEFRPTVYAFKVPKAGLSTTRGDVVDVAHDVVEWGRGWGRVESIVAGSQGDAAATVRLDEVVGASGEPIGLDPSLSYGIQFRTSMGGKIVVRVTPHSVETDTFYIQGPLPSGFSQIQVGDAAIVGERDYETVKLLITGVRYSTDMSAEFSAVNYDPRVAPYWANPPESIISEVSGVDYGIPPPPVITGVVSSPANDTNDDAGIPVPSVNIGFVQRDRHIGRQELLR